MIRELVDQRLRAVMVLPEFRAALTELAEQDEEAALIQPEVHSFLQTLYLRLGGTDARSVQPFVGAWVLLRATISRLDHVQDGDTDETQLQADSSVASLYNAALAYYVLSTALLDELETKSIPAARLFRLRRLWADNLLCAASGQQRDLGYAKFGGVEHSGLEHYQQAAEAKSGTVFALAVGGVAALASDDTLVIQACRCIGHVYGTLLQFSDDLLDASQQTRAVLTLPQIYTTTRGVDPMASRQELSIFWRQYIYPAYLTQVEQALKELPHTARTDVLQLFAVTFGQPHVDGVAT